MEAYHLFIEGYHRVGEMTTGNVVGEAANGTTNQSRMNKFNETGAPGKRAGIGRSKIPGVSRVCNPEDKHRNLLERSSHNLRQDRKLMR
jgi:hypothetical protein